MYFLPSLEDPFFDPSKWEDVLTDVQGHEEEFLVLQAMDSSHSFRIMQSFAFSLNKSPIRTELEYALSGPSPFHHFNSRVEDSALHEEWADYKFNAHMEWVKSQVDCFELVS
jgi:hypothetical protein